MTSGFCAIGFVTVNVFLQQPCFYIMSFYGLMLINQSQGDQIERNIAYWAIVYFGHFFEEKKQKCV
jgi:hypothetical protein